MYRKLALFLVLVIGSLTVMGGNDSRLSVDLKRLVAQQDFARRAAGQNGVCAFVKFRKGDGELLLAQYGCQKVTQIGDIYIANIPIGQLDALSSDDNVERVETQLGGKLLNDMTPVWVNSSPVRSGLELPHGFDGTGVLLGIVDHGFDVTHPAFYAVDGKTYRIKGFVDELAVAEETKGIATPIGREYLTQEDILTNSHLGGTEGDHATHCLGTAAGSGYATPYRGIAYGADIFAVSSRNAGMDNDINSADQVARMKRIFDYAEEHHQPCVISYSIGFNDVPGDTKLLSEAVEKLVGPGRILVVAAGNENGRDTYVNKPQGKKTAGAILLSSNKRDRVFLQSEQPFKLKCLTAKIDIVGKQMTLTDSIVFDTKELPTDTVVFRGHHILLEKDGTFYTLTDRLERVDMDDYPALALAIEGEDAEVEMFLSQESSFFPLAPSLNKARFACAIPSHNLGLPATLPSVITVGALNGRELFLNAKGETVVGFGASTPVGTIANFSSVGPTRDGRIKPDVVAPGVNIISAGNSFLNYNESGMLVTTTVFQNKNYPWCVMSGTSMATPCVAGIVALWLQANPQLSPDDVKEIIKATCRKPEAALEYPNNTYGYGLIDAYAGIKEALKSSTGIERVEQHSLMSDEWFTLWGTRTSGKPAGKGVFIHQGKIYISK